MANLRCPKCGGLFKLQQNMRMTGLLEITTSNDGIPLDAYQLFGEAECENIEHPTSSDYLICGKCGWRMNTYGDAMGAVERVIKNGWAILD